jgi:hypothetical protein
MAQQEEPQDDYEHLARRRLEGILGVTLNRLRPGEQGRRHDFETIQSDGQIVAVEVTSRLDARLFAQLAAIRDKSRSFDLPGSTRLWMVVLAADAQVSAIRRDEIRQLLLDLEAGGKTTANSRDDYRDPFVQRLRALRIDAVYRFGVRDDGGKVVIEPYAMPASRGWYGTAIDEWLSEFLASGLGRSKVGKLNDVADAAERHLVIVLDPTSPEGLTIPLGLSDRDEPTAAALVMPSLVPPEQLTHLWIFAAVHSWAGLRWARGQGWSVVPPLTPLGAEG